MTVDGPDIWAVIEVPPGVYQVALYFFNKDGHDGPNRWRDYTVELKRWVADYAQADAAPSLARSRVRQFWGGNYKVFAVGGPGKFLLKVGRNGSFNTILPAVLISRLAGPTTAVDALPMPWMGNLRYDPPTPPAENTLPNTLGPALSLWSTAEQGYESAQTLASLRSIRLTAYRLAAAEHAPDALLANWRWKVPLWTDADRAEFERTMKQAWSEMQRMNSNNTDQH